MEFNKANWTENKENCVTPGDNREISIQFAPFTAPEKVPKVNDARASSISECPHQIHESAAAFAFDLRSGTVNLHTITLRSAVASLPSNWSLALHLRFPSHRWT